MATIDLSLDALKIPALDNFTPDFGTMITETQANKGGLSTFEVNRNMMMPWAYMRPKVVVEDSVTTVVEYDAKLTFSASLQAGVTLTMDAGDYEGCEVSLRNLSSYACTVEHNTFSLSIPAGGFVRIIWNGTTWEADVSSAVGSGIILPPTAAAVHAAIGNIKERIVVNYAASSTTFKCTRSTPWSISGSKTGYYPLVINYLQGWSGLVLAEVEQITRNNGSFSMRGTASAVYTSEEDFNAYAQVVWVKL